MKVLVTAANGNVARQVIPLLVADGHRIRAIRGRPGSEAELLATGVAEVMIGDIRNADDIARAVEGVDAIFHVCPGGLAYWERDIGGEIIFQAERHGVGHVVFSTLLHPIISDLLQHASKRDVEEMLVSSRLKWTILQPCDYMQTLVPPSTFRTGELPVAYGHEQRHSVVDLRDVAEAAARVLREGEAHHYARYELCGRPQSIDASELAQVISEVCGRLVVAKPVTGPEFMRIWAAEDGPPIGSAHGLDDPAGRAFAREVLVAIERWYGAHVYMGNSNVLRWLLGREPRSVEDYVRSIYRPELAES
ncbi:SDR family oxidoreductase [Sphingobium sp.]|uniref:SDR family oxidoreductase n=1 Tax=Sphingobium sp. TaxID=1912891 RepID=UPI0028BD5585|nr:NAD(P)H-binding protein [Sphingobium sp.]